MVARARKLATFEDIALHDEPGRVEIHAGELVERAAPSPGHGFVENRLAVATDPFNRRPGNRGPGGWWIFGEIHVGYPGGEIYCHDAAGWRRDRLATKPHEWPVRIRPDWVCEVASPKHEKRDLVVKPRVLHAAEVPYYWVVNPEERVLLVHRWSRDGYVVVQRGTVGETIRPEPFEVIELPVSMLFGDEEDDDLED